MKKSLLILPIACTAPALFGCSSTPPEQKSLAPRVAPVQYVRHAARSAEDYYQLGRYYQGQNRLDQAEAAYLKALERHGNHVDSQNALGTLYSKQGKYDQAISLFTEILRTKPDIAKVYNNLGYTYYLQNKHGDAIAAFEKAIALEPGNARAYNNLGTAYRLAGEADLAKKAYARAQEIHQLAHAAPDPFANASTASVTVTANAPEKPVFVDLHPRISQSVALGTEPMRSVAIDVESPRVATLDVTHDETIPSLATKTLPGGASFNMGQPDQPPMATVTPSPKAHAVAEASRDTAPQAPAQDKNYAAAIGHDRKTVLPVRYRLEISNGNGITGMAKRTSRVLAEKGLLHARLTNTKPFQQQKTVIHYRAGYQQQARALSIKFGGNLEMVQVNDLRAVTDVKLVLGKDLTRQALAQYKQVMA